MDKTQKDNLVVDDITLNYIYCLSNHIIHLNLKKNCLIDLQITCV